MNRIEDYHEILLLIQRYSLAVSSGDDNSLRDYYAPGGVFCGLTGEFSIDTQFDEYLASLEAMREGAFPHFRQFTGNPVAQFSGDSATVESPVLLIANPEGGASQLIRSGLIRDEVVKIDGRWVFKHREAIVDGG